MDYILWTIAVLVGLYVAIRFVFAAFFRKQRYKG